MRIIVVMFLVASAFVPSFVTPFGKTSATLVVFAGQSNSRGAFLGLADVPLSLTNIDHDIRIWLVSRGSWAVLENGVNNVEDSIHGVGNWGAEAEFSRRWRIDNPKETLYIVKCGLVGPLHNDPANANNWSPQSGRYFDECHRRVSAARATLGGAIVSAVMWMQGEGDTGLGAAVASAYQSNLTNLVQNMRLKWGDTLTRMIVGRISDAAYWATQGKADVRARQAAYVAGDPLSRLIDTDSYPMQQDGVHYSAAGQVRLGADMYAAYKTLR